MRDGSFILRNRAEIARLEETAETDARDGAGLGTFVFEAKPSLSSPWISKPGKIGPLHALRIACSMPLALPANHQSSERCNPMTGVLFSAK